jgi:hypothetical protein
MAASLVALQLFSGTATAGETRNLQVTWSAQTQVTAGGQTADTITIKNADNQNLSHVILGIGVAPASGALPAGVAIVAVIGTDNSFCTWSAASVSCDFASIAAKKQRTLQVIFSASTAGLQTIPAAVSVNESGNPNGSNTQVFPANLGLTVGAATCDLLATYFSPGQLQKVLNTGGATDCSLSTGNPQSTKVSVPASVVSAIVVQENDSAVCQTGYTCFGQLSVGDLAVDGTYPVTWTIQWQVPSNFNLNQFGVIHFKDSGAFDFAIQNKTKNYCKSDTATGCFVGAPTKDGTTLTAVIRTAGNGGIKGFN